MRLRQGPMTFRCSCSLARNIFGFAPFTARAVAAAPDSAHALLSMAAWWERERRLSDAMECVDTCLSRHPQDPQALYYRAFLLHRQGRNDEAAAALSDLNKRPISDLNLKVSIFHLTGVVMDALGQYDEAWL